MTSVTPLFLVGAAEIIAGHRSVEPTASLAAAVEGAWKGGGCAGGQQAWQPQGTPFPEGKPAPDLRPTLLPPP